MFGRVEKYINIEEILKFAVGIDVLMIQPNPNRSTKWNEEDDRFKKSEKKPQFEQRESKHLPLKDNNYTLVNTTHIKILMEIHSKAIVNWLGKLRRNPKHKDKRKYYCFYHDHGHDTEDCQTLKDEIEYLIRRGYLNKCRKKEL